MIEIYNQTKQKINQKLVKKITQEIFKNAIHLAKSVCQSMKPICQLDQKNAEISIIFVGEKKIKQINKKYRKINKVTDVLSFGLWKVVRPLAEQNYFGEIFICYLRIIKQAKIFKTNVSQELKIILIHSILHLLGYDHKIKKDWEKMREMERKLLRD